MKSCQIKVKNFWIYLIIFLLLFAVTDLKRKHRKRHTKSSRAYTWRNPSTTRLCLGIDQTLKARRKSCFLRPDTGPCRADIIQWYFDVRQKRCYRFFWGGCQGNGNRFEKEKECLSNCFLNLSDIKWTVPHFCSLSFDYGNCFGYFNRWAWDPLQKSCRRHLYSGCGGNQNNFETRIECLRTCLHPPNNTLQKSVQYTTCIPIEVPEIL